MSNGRIKREEELEGKLKKLVERLKKSESSRDTFYRIQVMSEEALKFLAEQRSNYDAVVPLWEDGKIEPLHAIYRKKAMLKATKEAIRKGALKKKFIWGL